MAGIQDYLNQIKNAIYGKDVRQAIHDGIQQCYYDGKAGSTDLKARQRLDSVEPNVSSLKSRITNAESNISTLDARVDQIVAPSGQAPSAAEITDARVGDDGIVYTNLGDAVRAQVANSQNEITAMIIGDYKFRLIPNKYILRDNGKESNFNGWSATGFIACPPNYTLSVDIGGAKLIWGARYDSAKTYVEAYGWTDSAYTTYTNNTDEYTYFRISGKNAEMSNLKMSLSPNSGSDINIPSYYKSHLSTQESAIRYHENNCSAKGDSLVFLTDTHHSDDYAINDNKESNYANACHSVDLIKHIMAHTGVRMIVFGGDLINSTTGINGMIHGIHCYGAKFGEYKSRLVYCVGNHEYFTDLGQEEPDRPTAEWLYSSAKHLENEILGVGAKGSYYFDNVPQKIRYFVIPCGRDTEVDATQASWVMEEFEKVPDGYHIILIGHAFLVDMMNGFRGQYKYILEAFDAVKAKSQYSYNGVAYDYSGLDVIPVCAITGHTHIDGSLSTTGGIPCICTTCDSYRQNYEIQGGELVNVPRTKDTVDEQAFDVFQFDFTNRKIYCHRIGFGSDRQFTY